MQLYEQVPLDRPFQVHSVVTAYDITRERGFYFPGETHDFWEAVYVVSGNVLVAADEQIYRLSSGQMIFHKPMEFHRIWTTQSSAAHLYIVSFTAVGEGMRYFEGQQFRLTLPQESLLHRAVGELAGILQQVFPPVKRHLAAIHLEEFLLSLMENGPWHAPIATEGAATAYQQIVSTIYAHLEEDISVPLLAKWCNRSVSSLNKVFRRFSDRGVMQFVLTLKIRRAMEWLDEGIPIVQISDQLCFSSVNYFHVAFKRETGMTPSEYRSRQRMAIHGKSD